MNHPTKIPLSDVCQINMGQSPVSSSYNQSEMGIPFYQGNADFGRLHPKTRFWCSKPKKIAQRDDILISVRAPIGAMNIANETCCIGRGLAAITANEEKADAKFLFYFLTSKNVELNAKGTGSTFKAVSKKTISETLMPNIPIAKQRSMVSILENAEELIYLRTQQLSKLDQLVTSKFIEMFGDPVFNSKCWEKDVLSNYIDFLTSGSRGWAKYFSEDGEIFITIKNVKNNRIILDDVQYVLPPDNKEAIRTRVKSGDLLISITADLGRTGVVSEEIASHGAYINQHLCIVRLKQALLNPIFLSYYLESSAGKQQFERKNQNGVKAGLNFAAINSLEILIPPLEFQDQFSSFVTQVETQKNLVKQSLDLLELNKKSLMQQYFGA